MKRTISLTLVLAMLLTAMLGVISFAEDGETEAAPRLKIEMANLSFEDAVYPLFAVNYTAVYGEDKAAALDNVKLKVYDKNDELIETLSPDTSIEAPDGTIAFKHMEIGLKNMGDIYTYKAVNVVNDEEKNASEDVKYSILEYAIKITKSADENLKNAIAKMIAVGKAAQIAFGYTDYDYNLADYDLENEKYGIVVVGGATADTRKTIAKVDSVLTPEADSKIFTKDDVKLYNLSFDVVESGSVTVAEGVSRYFFYGSDLWGAEGSYDSKDGTTTSPNAGCNLDLDLYSGKHNKILVSAYAGADKGYTYSLRMDKYLKTGVIEAMPKANKNYGATSASSQRPWSLVSPSTQNTVAFKDGYREINKGWLHLNAIDDPATEGTKAPSINLEAPYTTVAKNFLVDGKFTVTLSIAKKAGEAYTENPFVIGTSSKSLELCHVEDKTVKIGDKVITNLREFITDAPEASDFTVFHFVVDTNDATVSVYTNDGAFVKSAVGASALSTVIDGGGYIRWSIANGSVWLNRCAISEGNIFN